MPRDQLSSIAATQGSGNVLSGRRIDATGGQSLFDRAKEVGTDMRDTTLRYVSGATGGFAVRNTNDLSLALDRIDEEVRSYYLISYRPVNQEFDGSFRQLEVKVSDPDYSVRHRSGYLALPRGMETLSGSDYELLRKAESGRVDDSLTAFLRLERFVRPTVDQPVLITLEVPATEIEFTSEGQGSEAVHSAEIEVFGVIREQGGEVLFRFGTPMNLQMTPAEYQEFQAGGLNFNNQVTLPPGRYLFQLLFTDKRAAQSSWMERSLVVSGPDEHLQTSSIVLGRGLREGAAQEGLLTVDGSTIIPTASRRYERGERLLLYLEAYASQESSPLTASISVSRSGSRQSHTLEPFQVEPKEDGRAVVTRYLELAGLPAGTYFLEARISSASGQETTSRTRFRIVQ